MKEFDSSKQSKEKVNIEIQKQQIKENKQVYQGTIFPHKGHTLFEINPMTLEIKKAEFTKQDLRLDLSVNKEHTPRSKVVMNPGMIYVSALNEKNAMKKLFKFQNGSKFRGNGIYIGKIE